MTRTAATETVEPGVKEEPCPHCGLKRSEAVKASNYERQMKQLRLEKAVADAESTNDPVEWEKRLATLHSHSLASIIGGIVVARKFYDVLSSQPFRSDRVSEIEYDEAGLTFRKIPIECNDGR